MMRVSCVHGPSVWVEQEGAKGKERQGGRWGRILLARCSAAADTHTHTHTNRDSSDNDEHAGHHTDDLLHSNRREERALHLCRCPRPAPPLASIASLTQRRAEPIATHSTSTPNHVRVSTADRATAGAWDGCIAAVIRTLCHLLHRRTGSQERCGSRRRCSRLGHARLSQRSAQLLLLVLLRSLVCRRCDLFGRGRCIGARVRGSRHDEFSSRGQGSHRAGSRQDDCRSVDTHFVS